MQPFVPAVTSDEAKNQATQILLKMSEYVVIELMKRLKDGKFDGSKPEHDFFAIHTPLGAIKPELQRILGSVKTIGSLEPIESYTFNIKLGDTPETNPRLKELYGWCEEILEAKALSLRPSLWSGSICGMDGIHDLEMRQPEI